MKMIDDIRRENLVKLRDDYGSLAALAAHLERSESQVSQWINASINSGTGKPRHMRTSTARWIEQTCSKPAGWMDTDHSTDSSYVYPSSNVESVSRTVESNVVPYVTWPFKRIDQARFLALPEVERSVIEGRLIEAIKDAETRIGKRSASGRH